MKKYKDLRIVYRSSGHPDGIRDRGGFLLFFGGVDKYAGQEERYRRELKERFALADYLLEALKERKN